MIFCHPQAKFFHRKVLCRTTPNVSSDSMQYARDCLDSESVYIMKETTAAAAVRVMDESNLLISDCETVPQSGESGCHSKTHLKTFYVSSIFIGLSFCNQNMKSADVTPSILDFIYRVNIYEGKRASMGIVVTVSYRAAFRHPTVLSFEFLFMFSISLRHTTASHTRGNSSFRSRSATLVVMHDMRTR